MDFAVRRVLSTSIIYYYKTDPHIPEQYIFFLCINHIGKSEFKSTNFVRTRVYNATYSVILPSSRAIVMEMTTCPH